MRDVAATANQSAAPQQPKYSTDYSHAVKSGKTAVTRVTLALSGWPR